MKEKEDCFHLGVKALIRNKEKKLLILERDLRSKRIWDLPGGRLQKGESTRMTLIRELDEEIGLNDLPECRPFSMILTDIRIPAENGEVGLIFSVFLVDILFPFHPKLSDEHCNFGWFSSFETTQKLTQYPEEFKEKLIHEIS